MDLLERDGQLNQLQDLLQGVAARGHGACVLVHGEAGAGKTSLLRRAVQRVAPAVPVQWAGCEPLLTPRPLCPFVDLAEQWPPTLAGALREGRHYPALLPDLRAALAARGAPALLVLDDLHWADAATLDAVRYLGRRLAGMPLLLVLSYRDDDGVEGAALRAMLGDLPAADTVPIAVPALSAGAVATLAQRAGRAADGVHACSGGNAFLVTELLSAPGAELPGSVAHAVASRLARMTPAGRAAAELVAASPLPLSRGLAEALLQAQAAGLDECCERGLLRAAGAGIGYRHELARLAVMQALPGGRAARLHRQLFHALQQVPGTGVQRLVHHAAHAGLDAQVLQLAPVAAAAAAALSAHREAASLYRRAVECCTTLRTDPPCALLEAAAAEARLVGDTGFARACIERALALHGRAGDTTGLARQLRLLAMLSWYDEGRRAPAQQAIEGAVATLLAAPGDAAARMELARVRAEQAFMRSAWSDYAGSVEVATQAVQLAAALPPSIEAQATLALAMRACGATRLFIADEPAAHAMLDEALALGLAAGADDEVSRIFAVQQMTSLIHRHHARALAVAERGLAWCEARDLDGQRARLLENRALSLLETGRWEEAEATIATCLALQACPDRLRQGLRFLHARLRLRRGDAPAAQADAGYWQALGTAPLLQHIGYRLPAILTACTEAAWLRGDATRAALLARQGADAALAGGEARLLGPLLVWLQRLGQPLPAHGLAIAPEHALELAGHHEDAARRWLAHGCSYEAALSGMHGDDAAMRQALSQLLALGARPAAEIARHRLHARGIRQVPRGPQPRTSGDPQGLTPRQRQVHALLQQGMSNAGIAARLHRSERTVESHVAQVLAKLGVASRVAVAARQPPS